MIAERWVPCILNSNYFVSNLGNVRRVTKGITVSVKPYLTSLGYYRIHMPQEDRNSILLHRLVALHFSNAHNLSTNKLVVNHIDGNKLNNEASNLEWCTQRDNVAHAHKMGLMNQARYGKSNPLVKLDPIKVINIRHCKGSITQDKLASLYNVSQARISLIWRRKQWAHV